MSVPAAKALSPAPVKISTFMARIRSPPRRSRRARSYICERECVARLRPVEGDAADAVAHVEKDVVLLFGHVCLRRAPVFDDGTRLGQAYQSA